MEYAGLQEGLYEMITHNLEEQLQQMHKQVQTHTHTHKHIRLIWGITDTDHPKFPQEIKRQI